MDTGRFDSIILSLSETRTRRGMLRLLGATALSAGGLSIIAGEEGDARRKRRRKNKKKNGGNGNGNGSGEDVCFQPGEFCSYSDQCCSSTTHYICAVSSYASNSDKTCCGGEGAVCGPQNQDGDYLPPHCCAGYECFYNTGSSTGICQKLPEDV